MSALLIRADGDEVVGTGHVMRCLALAQAWQAVGGKTIFALTAGAEPLVPRLISEGAEIKRLHVERGSNVDARATIDCAVERKAQWVVADGYCFGAGYQRQIKKAGLSLLFVDDNGHAGEYCADLVLNQNQHAVKQLYAKHAPRTRLLLGAHYAMLRREFLRSKRTARECSEEATKLLVTLGGADPENLTSLVISAIEKLEMPNLEARVVVGPLHQNLPALRARVKDCRMKISLLTGEVDMPELMGWADAAIAGAGSTSWELCFMGVPSLLVVLAENQIAVAKGLVQAGAAISFNEGRNLSPQILSQQLTDLLTSRDRRAALTRNAQSLVDGKGAQRVVAKMRAKWLKLRKAKPEDCRLLWEWANDPGVRSAAFSEARIPWDQHVNWFQSKVNDPGCFIFLGFDAGEAIGQIRFDVNAEEAVVDVSVAPGHRGLGYGQLLIRRGVEELISTERLRQVSANVKPDNISSRRAFESAGFRQEDGAGTQNHGVHYVRHLGNGTTV